MRRAIGIASQHSAATTSHLPPPISQHPIPAHAALMIRPHVVAQCPDDRSRPDPATHAVLASAPIQQGQPGPPP